jgi:DNA-binding PadR family transcriptional regulator
MNAKTTVTPLTPAVFHILLALASGEKHGYEMMKQIKHDSRGQVTMGSGTLYGSIKRMLIAALIEEAGERSDSGGEDERRRYYRLTELGRGALLAELNRYDQVVSLAHQRCLFGAPQVEGSR